MLYSCTSYACCVTVPTSIRRLSTKNARKIQADNDKIVKNRERFSRPLLFKFDSPVNGSLYIDYKKPDQEYVEEILSVLSLQDRRKHLPRQLSGGQQQRVAIGRALITRPMLILADEPTGNLDTQNSSEVISLLKTASMRFRQTIIMITHNRSVASAADRVLQVSDGLLTDLGRGAE